MKAILTEIRIAKEAEFGLFSLVHGDRLGSMTGRFAIRTRLVAVCLAAFFSFSAAFVAAFEGSLFNSGSLIRFACANATPLLVILIAMILFE